MNNKKNKDSLSVKQLTGFKLTGDDTLLNKLINVLEQKHRMEEAILYENRKFNQPGATEYTSLTLSSDVFKKEYYKEINSIKAIKNIFENYLNDKIRNDSDELKKQNEFYCFKDPYSSIFSPTEIISLLGFFKIFEHFIIQSNRDTLPSLKEATKFLNK